MTSSPKTRMADATNVSHSTSRGEAATDPARDRLRILRAPTLVYAYSP